MLPASVDPSTLGEQLPKFRYYFRYPLHADDFTALRVAQRLHGYYAAKPLYAGLDARGRVDRNAGFSGEIAGVFVPSPARGAQHARLFFAHLPPDQIIRTDGKRNWPAIRSACEQQLRVELALPRE